MKLLNQRFKENYLALPHATHILIWLAVGCIGLGIALFGAGKVRDAWQLHEYEKMRAVDIKKAQDAEALANQAIGQAKIAEQQRDAALKQADEAHQQLVEAVEILNDATKTTAQKREAYNQIINQPAPLVVSNGNSIEDLCATARRLGLDSAACQ